MFKSASLVFFSSKLINFSYCISVRNFLSNSKEGKLLKSEVWKLYWKGKKNAGVLSDKKIILYILIYYFNAKNEL